MCSAALPSPVSAGSGSKGTISIGRTGPMPLAASEVYTLRTGTLLRRTSTRADYDPYKFVVCRNFMSEPPDTG